MIPHETLTIKSADWSSTYVFSFPITTLGEFNLISIQGQIGNININIPIDGEDKVLTTIPSSKFIVKKIKSEIETISYPENNNSVLENYNNYKKYTNHFVVYNYIYHICDCNLI